MKKKFFSDYSGAAEKLFQDAGRNNFKIYEVNEYQRVSNISVHPEELADKWSQVIVATSGDPSTGRSWIIVAPYRVDSSRPTGEKSIDIDPVLFVFDGNSGASHPSGVVGYHQGFSGRTTAIPGYENKSLEETVANLRKNIVKGLEPLPSSPPEVISALHHMVNKFQTDFFGKDEGKGE